MHYEIWMASAMALFAVFGLISAVRMLSEWLFGNGRLSVAVEVRDKQDAEALDMLLEDAARAAFARGVAPVVLLSVDLMDGTVGEGEELSEYYADLIDRYGAECYLIEP